jgi:protein-disulfide isomerase
MASKKAAFFMIVFSFSFAFLLIFSKSVYKARAQFSEHLKGFLNASVNITVYGEYQCFRTRNFWNNILPRLEDEYIKTGKVKLIYKFYPKLFFNYSLEAAEASECAGEQGRFWEYVGLVFQRTNLTCGQAGKGIGLSPNDLKEYAKELGLDMRLFSDCLDSKAMLPRIQAYRDELHKKGIRASGVVFVNEKLMSGNMPYDEFKKEIEGFLNGRTREV